MAKYEDVDVNSITSTSKYEEVDPKTFTSEKEVDNDPYRVKEAWTALKTAGKGVPVLGNYIPEDGAMKNFADQNPWTSKGLQVAGGMTSFIPIVRGAQIITKAVPLARSLAAQMGIYGTAGAGVAAADAATDPNAEEGDIASRAKTGGIMGMFGPVAGKLLSPKPLPAPKPTLKPSSPYMDPAHRMGPLGRETDEALAKLVRSAGAKAKAKITDAPLPPWAQYDKTKMLTSGILTGGSLFGGMGVIPAGIIGSLPYALPAGVKLARKASQASWANKPVAGTNLTTKDIINAMALQQAGNQGE